MAAKKGKKKVKVQDLKPKRDAKGGFTRYSPGGNSPGGNSPGGNSPGGNSPGGNVVFNGPGGN